MSKPQMKLEYCFVPMGQVAPDRIPPTELWLDVGNRVAPRILDHHGGNTSAWSAAQLVLENIQTLIVPHFHGIGEVRIVLHVQPDLDAICSAWLIKKQLVDLMDIQSIPELTAIVEWVSRNDQGLVKTKDAAHCWPIVMRSLIGTVAQEKIDEQQIGAWFRLFDDTLKILRGGGSFSDAAENIVSSELRVILDQEHRDYEQDVERGRIFQIMLPLQHQFSLKHNENTFDGEGERRVLGDALFLRNPSSILFKELAKGDVKNSPQKRGFAFLIVSRDVKLKDGRVFQRHIISVDPLSGFNLASLGSLLEKQEQKKEDESRVPRLPGRERVEPGKGRFGGNVVSPWYDGRGHGYTIIDSPSIEIEDGCCFSQLDSQDVLETIWEYGDPARFIQVKDAELICFQSKTYEGSEAVLERTTSLENLLSARSVSGAQWSHEFRNFAERVTVEKLHEEPGNAASRECEVDLTQWRFFSAVRISVERARVPAGAHSLFETSRLFRSLRNAPRPEPSLEARTCLAPNPPQYLVCLTVQSYDGSLGKGTPALDLALYRLAAGLNPGFPERGEYDVCTSLRTIATTHANTSFHSIPGGYVLIVSGHDQKSTREISGGKSDAADSVIPLLAFNLAIKDYLQKLSADFLSHLSIRRTSILAKILLEDREKLLWFENSTQIERVSEDPFLQQLFAYISSHFEIAQRFQQANKQIRTLAEAMKESRANLLSRLSFIVTTGVSPLLLTLSFFGGRFLDKEFTDRYSTFFPERLIQWLSRILGIGYGWTSFFMILLTMYVVFLLIWKLLGRNQKKRISKARINKRPFSS